MEGFALMLCDSNHDTTAYLTTANDIFSGEGARLRNFSNDAHGMYGFIYCSSDPNSVPCRGNEQIIRAVERSKFVVPKGYWEEYKRARVTFRHHIVYDPRTQVECSPKPSTV